MANHTGGSSHHQRILTDMDVRLVAFAYTICRSKPEHLSILEYLEELRRHVVRRPRQYVLSHLDMIEIWKARHERTETLLKTAQSEIASLKLQLEQRQAPATKTNKRRTGTNNRSSSPQKLSRASSPVKPGLTTLEVLGDLGVQPSGGSALLLRHLFNVHTVFDQQTKLDPHELAFHLINATRTIVDVVHAAVQDGALVGLESILTGLARAVSYLYVAIARLSKASRGRETEGRVIYAYVDMFSRILDMLGEASTKKSESNTGQGNVQSSPSRLCAEEEEYSKTKSLLTRFLFTIIARLELKIAVHQSLLEGYSFCVLSQAGDRLYALLFGHKRRKTLEEEIAYSSTAYPIVEGGTQYLDRDDDHSIAKAEANNLIHLVKYINKAYDTLQNQVTPGVLRTTAKKRLQHTLIKCTFGMEGLADNSPLLDCLKMPLLPDEPLPAPKAKDASIPEWYAQQLWEMVGWDMLVSEHQSHESL